MSAYTIDQIAAALAAHDLPLLRTLQAARPPTAPFSPRETIQALTCSSEARSAELLIALFLRHPDYAEVEPELADTLPWEDAYRLRHLYTAAVYLQHLWHSQLTRHLGSQPTLPELYGQSEWSLPAPTVHYGEAGLRELAARVQGESGVNWASSYENARTLLLNHLAMVFPHAN
ncbi:MAG: hypothetical protein KDD73_08010 [Anaerolineales bacterium]|nr:hypothetical protein [Anaerolineales bacterium]MCB9129054.1 hypothetical protein [Ardenticatenales bacterium]